MNLTEYLLSVVSNSDGDTIHIHADDAGLAHLAKVIEQMRKKLQAGSCGDAHLFSGAWGRPDGELTQTMLQAEKDAAANQVHHMKIFGWTEEWKQKHAL